MTGHALVSEIELGAADGVAGDILITARLNPCSRIPARCIDHGELVVYGTMADLRRLARKWTVGRTEFSGTASERAMCDAVAGKFVLIPLIAIAAALVTLAGEQTRDVEYRGVFAEHPENYLRCGTPLKIAVDLNGTPAG